MKKFYSCVCGLSCVVCVGVGVCPASPAAHVLCFVLIINPTSSSEAIFFFQKFKIIQEIVKVACCTSISQDNPIAFREAQN